jgi:hypothetical protein
MTEPLATLQADVMDCRAMQKAHDSQRQGFMQKTHGSNDKVLS